MTNAHKYYVAYVGFCRPTIQISLNFFPFFPDAINYIVEASSVIPVWLGQ